MPQSTPDSNLKRCDKSLTFKSLNNQTKATSKYFAVVLFIMLYKVVLTFESVDKVLNCSRPFKCKLLRSTFACYGIVRNIEVSYSNLY